MALKEEVIDRLTMSEEELADVLIADISQILSRVVGIENSLNHPMVIDPINTYDETITALVGLAGSISGLVSLHLPKAIALQFTASMLSGPITEVNDDVYDALGELTVMIAGSIKDLLRKQGFTVFLSTPSVFTGMEYAFSSKTSEESMAFLLDIGDQWFMVNFNLQLPTD